MATVEDELIEPDETFTVRLLGFGVGATGTVLNDDAASVTVADASAEEGDPLVFTVTLDKAAGPGAEVRVGYATADVTARAGEDYEEESDTLVFAPGETALTVEVATLDDAMDEGVETLELRLSGGTNAILADAVAIGSIENDDLLPKVWLSRCGRAIADHVVGAVDARLHEGPAERTLALGGLGAAEAADSLDPDALEDPDSRGATMREVAAASSFLLPLTPASGAEEARRSAAAAAADGDRRWTAWGSGATTRLEARAGQLSMEGEVTGATLGLDAEAGPWTTGVAVAHNECEGTYDDGESGDKGTISSPLTSVHPYLRWTDGDLSLWSLAGYGRGEFALRPDGGRIGPVATDLEMRMAAAGARLDLAEAGGVAFAARTDATAVWMSTEAVENLVATRTHTNLLRLTLEGRRRFALASGGEVEPVLEAGLRHDGGDADRGLGVEVGGRLRWSDPARGLTVEARGRGLVAHEADGYEEWGAAGSVSLDPGPDRVGLSFDVRPSLGTPESGVAGLWDEAASEPDAGVPARLEAELGYGLAAQRGRAVITPVGALGWSHGGERVQRLGLRLWNGERIETSLTGERTATAAGETAHALFLRLTATW